MPDATTPPLGGITRYHCPLPSCGWHHDLPPALASVIVARITHTRTFAESARQVGKDHAMQVEQALRDHVDTHSVTEYLSALVAEQRRVHALTEATVMWRDRPGGDVGLAMALANILDLEQPEPPASAALVRVLRECDRIEREVYGQHDEDDDGAREAVRRIRAAAGVTVPDPQPDPRCDAAVRRLRPEG